MRINNVVMVGRLVATPETKNIVSKKDGVRSQVLNGTIAFNRSKDSAGEFFEFKAYNGSIKFFDTVAKGDEIGIEGRLSQETWTKEGVKHSKVVIVGEKFSYGAQAAVKTENTPTPTESPVADDAF